MKITSDQGFATVVVTSVVAVMCVISTALLSLVLLISARTQVQRAADLVALAAAPISDDAPCEVAREVAQYNDVILRHCEWSEGRANVVVDRPTGLALIPKLTAAASARATISKN